MKRTALITGSASGLAVAFAHRLAAQGYDLTLNYRSSKENCDDLVGQLEMDYGVQVHAVQADMTSASDIEALMDEIESRCGGIDTLIHSAGPFVFTRKRLTEYTDSEWDQMISGNLTSAFYLCKRAIPWMRPHGFGRIVTIGFDRVEDAPGWIYRSAYAAAKVGLASLTRTIAQEERENGITANMICPGDIRGEKKEALHSPDRPWSPVAQPVGGDLAEVVAFLLSAEAQYVTGNILSVNGGVDVIGGYDLGKKEVFDPHTIAIGARVRVLPWQRLATVTHREDRNNRRSIYTVEEAGHSAQFTVDQLVEVPSHGV